jgi:hypothetical protein
LYQYFANGEKPATFFTYTMMSLRLGVERILFIFFSFSFSFPICREARDLLHLHDDVTEAGLERTHALGRL